MVDYKTSQLLDATGRASYRGFTITDSEYINEDTGRYDLEYRAVCLEHDVEGIYPRTVEGLERLFAFIQRAHPTY